MVKKYDNQYMVIRIVMQLSTL